MTLQEVRFLCKIRTVQSDLVCRITRRFCAQQYTTQVPKMAAIKSIKDLGYAFNADGQLRKINQQGEITNEPFQFNISDKHQECQAHYEEIGSAVTDHVYHLLETKENLIRLPVPEDSTPKTGSFVFASKEYNKKDVLLILTHGSGVVRAGQWARSLIINESLDKGTQIPYIRKAAEKDYGILILNSNDNSTADGKEITKSSTPEEHAVYVWNTYVSKAKASSILIVAHSYGGVVTMSLSSKFEDDFKKRVKAIAYTDSVHGYTTKGVSDHLKQIAKNWISSPQPLDTPIQTPDHDIPRVSAGHKKHEMTSYTSMDAVFNFFEEKLKKK